MAKISLSLNTTSINSGVKALDKFDKRAEETNKSVMKLTASLNEKLKAITAIPTSIKDSSEALTSFGGSIKNVSGGFKGLDKTLPNITKEFTKLPQITQSTAAGFVAIAKALGDMTPHAQKILDIQVALNSVLSRNNGLLKGSKEASRKLSSSYNAVRKSAGQLSTVNTKISKGINAVAKGTERAANATNTLASNYSRLNSVQTQNASAVSANATKTNMLADALIRANSGSRKLGTALSTVAKSAKQTSRQMNLLQQISSRLKSLFLTLSSIAVFAYMRRAVRAVIGLMARFEQSMANVQAITNSTNVEFRKLDAVARELGATTIFTAEQAAEGLLFLSRAGFTAQESIQALPEALKLAQASGVDFSKAADLMTRALKGFGLETSKAGEVANIFASTASASNVTVESLGEAFTHIAPLARAFGVSINESSAALAVLGDAGIRGGRAGRNLRTAFISLAKITPRAEAVLNKYGLTAEDVNVKTHGLSTVLDRLRPIMNNAADTFNLFRARAAPVIQALVRNTDAFNHLRENVVGAEGELDRMSRTMTNTLIGSFKGFRSALAESVIQLGGQNESGTFVHSLAQSFKFLGSLISELNGASSTFNENNHVTREMAKSTRIWAISLEQIGKLLQAGAVVGAVTLLTQAMFALIAGIRGASAALVVARLKFALIAGAIGLVSFGIVKASDALNDFTGQDFSIIQNGFLLIRTTIAYIIDQTIEWYERTKLLAKNVLNFFGAGIDTSSSVKEVERLASASDKAGSFLERFAKAARDKAFERLSAQIKDNNDDFKVAQQTIKTYAVRLNSLRKNYIDTGKATEFTKQVIAEKTAELKKQRTELQKAVMIQKEIADTQKRLQETTDAGQGRELQKRLEELNKDYSELNFNAINFGKSISGTARSIEAQQQAFAKAFAPAITSTKELNEAQKRRLELSRSTDAFKRDIDGARQLESEYNKVNTAFERFNKRFIETGSVTDVQLASYMKLRGALLEQREDVQRLNDLKKEEKFLIGEVRRAIREQSADYQKFNKQLAENRQEQLKQRDLLKDNINEAGLSESIKNLTSNVKDQIDRYKELRSSASSALNTIFDGFKRAITQSKDFGDFVKNIGLAFLEATGNAVKLVVQQKILNALGFGGENTAASGSIAERLLNSTTSGAGSAAGEAVFKEAGKALTKEVGKGAKQFAGTVVTASATSAATTTAAGKVAGTSMAVGGETAGVAMAAGGKAAGAANTAGSAAGALAITKAFAPILIGLAAAAVLFGTFKSISDRERNRNAFIEDSIIKRYENIGKLLNLTGKNLETFIESSVKSQTGRTISGSRLEELGIQGAETGFTNQDILDFRKDLLSRYTRENLNNIIEGFSRRDVVVGNVVSSQIGTGNLQERYNQKYSSGNKVNFQIIDQRQSEIPLQAEAVDIGTNSDGTQQFKIFVRDAVGDVIQRGQLDNALKSRYGINRRGT